VGKGYFSERAQNSKISKPQTGSSLFIEAILNKSWFKISCKSGACQTTLEQNKKNKKIKIHPWWGLHVGGKGVLL
jgi:hypothetical protein